MIVRQNYFDRHHGETAQKGGGLFTDSIATGVGWQRVESIRFVN
jgi:hypothetical protein